VSQVPLLGDIPVLGELFKSRSTTRSRSRFYVFIRTNILRNEGFEDLKYISDVDVQAAGLDDGWPTVEPRVMQ
jgi:type II secretory pathway component GspD/PulD (secretin)